jgi:hypothetical protein
MRPAARASLPVGPPARSRCTQLSIVLAISGESRPAAVDLTFAKQSSFGHPSVKCLVSRNIGALGWNPPSNSQNFFVDFVFAKCDIVPFEALMSDPGNSRTRSRRGYDAIFAEFYLRRDWQAIGVAAEPEC